MEWWMYLLVAVVVVAIGIKALRNLEVCFGISHILISGYVYWLYTIAALDKYHWAVLYVSVGIISVLAFYGVIWIGGHVYRITVGDRGPFVGFHEGTTPGCVGTLLLLLWPLYLALLPIAAVKFAYDQYRKHARRSGNRQGQ